jgi:hypothetical protein
MSPYSNTVCHTNSKCGVDHGTIKNLNFLICLLFSIYSSTNLKFVTQFVVHMNSITYLTNMEGSVICTKGFLLRPTILGINNFSLKKIGMAV